MITEITAHSGSDNTKENSIEFIKKAIKMDVNALEIDVRKHESGQLVLSHDSLDEIVNLDDLVKLEDAFRIIEYTEKVCVNCDLKEENLEMEVIEIVKKYNGLKNRIIFSGSVTLENLKKNPEIKEYAVIYMNVERIIKKTTLEEKEIEAIINICNEYGIRVINIDYRLISEDFIRAMEENKIGLSVWTVDNYEDMKRMLESRVFNITTRNASILRNYINQEINMQ